MFPKIKNFFASAFKNKRMVFFVLLFFVALTITFLNVQSVQAQTVEEITKKLEGPTCKSWGPIDSATAGIVDLVAGIPEVVAVLISYITGWIISTVLSWSITTGTSGAAGAFVNGWYSVKDLANMLIVLGFVVVGIATTLRIREYEAKKFLLPLIIVALLLNFSNVFCGLIIDASNITMKGLVTGGTTADMSGGLIKSLKTEETRVKCEAQNNKAIGSYITASLIFGALYAILAIVFIYLAAILAARYVILGLLFTLSPLAVVFAAFPFPKANGLWKTWLEHFLKWAFIGVSLCFFLNIAANTLKSFSPTGFMDTIGYMIVIIVIIFVGVKISVKGSGAVGVAAMALAAGTGSLALGMAAKTPGISGLASRGGAAAKDWTTQKLENMNLMSKGTTAEAKKNRLAESTKRLENIQDNSQLAKIAEQRAATPKMARDKAAAAEILAKRNAFSAVDPRKREGVAAFSTSYGGVSKETFTKGRPETFAGATDKEAIADVKSRRIEDLQKNAGFTLAAAKIDAAGYKPTDVEIRDSKKRLEGKRITENALGLGPVTDKEIFNNIVDKKQKEYVKLGHTHEEARNMTKSYKQEEMTDEINAARESFSQERVQRAVKHLSTTKVAELPEEAINIDTIGSFSENQLVDGIQKKGSATMTEKVKNFATKGTEEYKQLRTKLLSLPKGSPERRALSKAYLAIKDNY